GAAGRGDVGLEVAPARKRMDRGRRGRAARRLRLAGSVELRGERRRGNGGGGGEDLRESRHCFLAFRSVGTLLIVSALRKQASPNRVILSRATTRREVLPTSSRSWSPTPRRRSGRTRRTSRRRR